MGKEALYRELKQPASAKYDCLVPISGGKDSSYVLYYLAKVLGLRVLAFFFDNGFICSFARENVQNMCGSMGVDLVIERATAYRLKQTQHALHAAKHLGRFVKVCGTCSNNLRTHSILAAKRQGIKHIVWGASDFEDSSTDYLRNEKLKQGNRDTWGTPGSERRKVWRALKLLFSGSPVGKLRAFYHGLYYMYYTVRDNLASGCMEGIRNYNPFLEVPFVGKGVQVHYFFDYIPYNPVQQVAELIKETGWRHPESREMRMDCMLHAFINYQHLCDNGITHDGFILAGLVRYGLMDRQTALVREAAAREGLAEECERIALELGVISLFRNWSTNKVVPPGQKCQPLL
ncbi:MAG TPA: hypothetical protein PLP17_10850 [Oligoflexia bacterium]|nr:hypothetical protein [Oligoflexia bacterium]